MGAPNFFISYLNMVVIKNSTILSKIIYTTNDIDTASLAQISFENLTIVSYGLNSVIHSVSWHVYRIANISSSPVPKSLWISASDVSPKLSIFAEVIPFSSAITKAFRTQRPMSAQLSSP